MTDVYSDDERPQIKRSKSDQTFTRPSIEITADDAASESSALSAPSRIEGHEDDLDSDEGMSVTSTDVEDLMDSAEDRPYLAQGEWPSCSKPWLC